MKQFLKFVLAATIGVFLAFFLMFIGLFIFGTVASMNQPSISSHSVLKLDMNRVVPEKTDNVDVSPLSFQNSQSFVGLRDIKRLIKHAADDSKIDGILIDNKQIQINQASASSLREELERFKESGKFIYAYSDYYSQSAYYLASVADSVWLNPNGFCELKGYGTMIPFFKDMFDDLGVKMNVFYAGNFKSATEPFRRTEMSEENKLQTKEYLDDLIAIYKEDVARSRNITTSDVDRIMQEYLGKTAESSLSNGLVDALYYKDQMEDIIRSKTNRKEGKRVKYVSIDKYWNSVELKKNSSKDEIAVVFAEGTVNYGTDAKGEINESVYLKALEKIEHDDDIKAVVLRVNSGGGSALTSDLIWRQIENIKDKGKPVIASFGDVAASGGYYIAAGADTIVAQPNSITGSIGVFSMLPNAKELFEDKLGIHFDTLKTHPLAVSFSPFTKLSAREEALLQEGVDDIYDKFLTRVADGRGMSKEAVHNVAQGRVWSGKAALQNGLVDVLGDLDVAISIAAERAGMSDDPKIKSFPYFKETFLDQFMKGLAQSDELAKYASIDRNDLILLKEIRQYKSIFEDGSPQARMPYIIKFD